MSKERTYITEIALGKGLLSESYDSLESSLALEDNFKEFYSQSILNAPLTASQFELNGRKIRSYLQNKGIPCEKIEWMGLKKQLDQDVICAQDLLVDGHLSVSIKENSNVLTNGSPSKIFEKLPAGEINRKFRASENWFEKIGAKEYFDYFELCRQLIKPVFQNYQEFENSSKEERKQFGKEVKELHSKRNSSVIAAYKLFCEKVSVDSAKLFNATLNDQSDKASVQEILLKEFFRIDKDSYIIAGVEKKKSFAYSYPSYASWSSKFSVLSITASPRLAGQPEVEFTFCFKNKETQEEFTKVLKAEVRWSHGKFCGNPESKIYKRWQYSELPWVEVMFSEPLSKI